jgi:hypothetical protein
MKKLFLLFGLVNLLTSCEQDTGVPDYRDQFIGIYSCVNYTVTDPYNLPPNYDTIALNLEIKKDPTSPNKIVLFSDTVQVNNSGTVSINHPLNSTYNIQFRNDSIFWYRANYFPGGSSTSTIIGVKTN